MLALVPGYGCGLARNAFFECWGELATNWHWPASALFDAHGDDGEGVERRSHEKFKRAAFEFLADIKIHHRTWRAILIRDLVMESPAAFHFFERSIDIFD